MRKSALILCLFALVTTFPLAPAYGQVNAIIINAGPTDVVNLRGLTLNGQGDNLGVHIVSAGRVSIEKSVIQQFGTGINVATSADIKLRIQNTAVLNNTNGVSIVPGGGTANVAIERSIVHSNSGIGVRASGAFGGIAILAMSDSSASLNGSSGVVAKSGSVASAQTSLIRTSFIANAQYGIVSDKTNAAGTAVRVGDSFFVRNGLGATQSIAGGDMISFGNNQIIGSIGSGFTGQATLQ